MKRYLSQLISLAGAFLSIAALSPTAIAEDIIRINGTGSAISIIKIMAHDFQKIHPGLQVEINMPAMGSGGGIRGLLAGALDIAISARPLKPEEREQGLIEQPFARTPFVLAVAGNNHQIDNLKMTELLNIYSGTTTTWPDGSRLRLILRPKTDSDTALLRSISPEADRAVTQAFSRKGMAIAMNDQESADMIEKIDGAIGTSLMSLLAAEQRPLRPLTLDGVTPSVKTIIDGSYPLHKTFRLISHAKHSATVQQFLEFVQSPQAFGVLTNNNCQVL